MEIQTGIPEEELLDVIGNVASPLVVLSELIKNGVDANANSITINIDSENNMLKIIDDGDGFSNTDVMNLGMATVSYKKREGNIYNENGEMLLGNKGLAIFSAFSLGKKLTIRTKNKLNECFVIDWEKETNNLSYRRADDDDTIIQGTEILIFEIDNNDMLLLTLDKELTKFKHISLKNFKKDIKIPELSLIKDGKHIDLEVPNIETFREDFDAKVVFNYDEHTKLLTYKFVTTDMRVYPGEVVFELKEISDIRKKVEEVYSFKTIKLSFDEYTMDDLITRDEITIPSFNGAWYMKANKKNEKMKKFNYGIRMYVNNFALYNYLNPHNDWLDLTYISGNKKFNNFKKHNVYGYVNFSGFNELKEGMKISNERGGFNENIYFRKFTDVIYSIVLYTSINIDVAQKNNSFINSKNVLLDAKESKDTDAKKVEESRQEKILRKTNIVIESGENIYLRDLKYIFVDKKNDLKVHPLNKAIVDNDIFLGTNDPGQYSILYCIGEIKEILSIKVKERKVVGNKIQQNDFFKNSKHFIGDIDLSDINDLVKQLFGLPYDQKYLLYVISFRAILEDMVKNYLIKRGINFLGNFKDNMNSMLSDLDSVLKVSRGDNLRDQKVRIKEKFKGHDALNNFLVGINVKFSQDSYDKFLHSLTHNPSKINEDLALEIANDVILPLYMLIKLLKDENVI
ncbi:ATP-binding protein [Bacillus cereus]|uniref:ATP-binding protein n=1 Tax=Bacillus cereus TaxID=1396 RepID=UPI00159695CF|nr:ATP-binding protein [Bacillus cereus]